MHRIKVSKLTTQGLGTTIAMAGATVITQSTCLALDVIESLAGGELYHHTHGTVIFRDLFNGEANMMPIGRVLNV